MKIWANPYERTTYHGKALDQASVAVLQLAEALLGYELTIVQGSYSTAVVASAGTHTKGRVFDLSPYDWKRKVRVLRSLGVAAFHREAIPGVWEEHIHCVLILDDWDNQDGVAYLAFLQISDYRHGLNGLKGHAVDTDPRPAQLVVFTYPPEELPVPVVTTNVTEARDLIVEAAHALNKAALKLEQTAPARRVARAQVKVLRGLSKSVLAVLRVLPAQ